MSSEEGWIAPFEEELAASHPSSTLQRGGFDPQAGIYHSLHKLKGTNQKIPIRPNLDTAAFVLSQFPPAGQAEKLVALIDSATNQRVTYAQLKLSIYKLATGLYHGLGVKKGDVIFVLSPNSLLYPTICLAVLSIGAVLTTANPLNTASEIAKQVRDSGTNLAISTPEEADKLLPTGVPTLLTSRSKDARPALSDTAVILYSSGTTGASKGVEITHSNLMYIVILLRWSAEVSSSLDDVFLCFLPMFHVYGLAFFALGLLAFPPVILALVVDVETGVALPPFRKGELWFKSPAVMKGYLGNQEATAATINADGWLQTGDLGYFDEDGCLYIVDRVKELIKHNGYQVAPAELEATLLSHTDILDAAVVPLDDEEAGQIPIAYVVKAANSELTEDQVIQFVASQVAPYKKVRKVSFIDAIPKSAAGKILRKDLVSQGKQKFVSRL
ncbi:unnamed protein product [Coffea canephora]|uniref:Uncharacterized protein n=1 Tax=Coffea canephora TaxID=49390 RepID=A0A068TUA2_COFCA|nr:unnamed protein product [Coffea canephora]